MRYEVQQRDKISATVEVVTAGAGQTGLSPTVVLRRISDGLFWNAAGVAFGASAVDNAMAAVDATNLPGLYRMDVPEASIDMVLGEEGYEYAVTEVTTSLYEIVVIDTVNEVSTDVVGLVTSTATQVTATEVAQVATTKSVYLAMQTAPPAYGLAGAMSASEIVLKMSKSGTAYDVLAALAADPFLKFVEMAKGNGNEAATTAAPTFSAGAGPAGEDIYIITVDDTSPFTVADYVRGKGKDAGEGHVHEVLAIPSGVLLHVHASSTAFDIVNGDTVEGVVPTGIYAGFVDLVVNTYFSVADPDGELTVVATGSVAGNAPKFTTAQQVVWVRGIELDLSGRTFNVG